jgi:hypothetical protein
MLDPNKRNHSSFTVSELIRACLVLSASDSNKPHLRSSNLLRLAADEVIRSQFFENDNFELEWFVALFRWRRQ